MNRSQRAGFRRSLAVSAGLHVGAVALMWAVAGGGEPLPKMRVYAVDIVSPPPQLAGPPDPGNGLAPSVAEPEPAPAAAAEPPTPEPPAAAAPPEPAPPEPTAKEEPAPKPPARNEKAPVKPAAKEPSKTASQSKPKAESRPAAPKAEAAKKPASKPAAPAGGGEGGGTGASRGANPDPKSSGGEGLDIHLRGMQCPSPDYCANIIRQLYRYFRPPSGVSSDQAEVFFYINRDGTVDDIRLLRSSGSYQFRMAAMEAVEQAGLNKAFGSLPRSFEVDRLPVSFFFRPAR